MSMHCRRTLIKYKVPVSYKDLAFITTHHSIFTSTNASQLTHPQPLHKHCTVFNFTYTPTRCVNLLPSTSLPPSPPPLWLPPPRTTRPHLPLPLLPRPSLSLFARWLTPDASALASVGTSSGIDHASFATFASSTTCRCLDESYTCAV